MILEQLYIVFRRRKVMKNSNKKTIYTEDDLTWRICIILLSDSLKMCKAVLREWEFSYD